MKQILLILAVVVLVGCSDSAKEVIKVKGLTIVPPPPVDPSLPLSEPERVLEKVVNITELPSKGEYDWTVPKGQEWKLVWSSPYKDSGVTPAYDVRFHGEITFGDPPKTHVSGLYSKGPIVDHDNVSINVLAGDDETVVWVRADTAFETANDYVNRVLKVYVYR